MAETINGGYVELHARSAFSFLRGASLPSALAARACEVGLSALAIVDRDGFYGSPRAWIAAAAAGIRAIYGCELTLEDGAVLPILVRDTNGYQNLCRLLTRSKLRAPKGEGVIFWDELQEVAAGSHVLPSDGFMGLGHDPRFLVGGVQAAPGRSNLFPPRPVPGTQGLVDRGTEVQRHRLGAAQTQHMAEEETQAARVE